MGINVQVNTDADPKKTTVSASGSIQHVITGNEVNSFGLSDSALKDAVAKYFGKRPNDAYLKSPTPWGICIKLTAGNKYKRCWSREVPRCSR